MTKEQFEQAIRSAINAPARSGTKWVSLERVFGRERLRGGGALNNAPAERITRIRQLFTTRAHPGFSSRELSQHVVLVLGRRTASGEQSAAEWDRSGSRSEREGRYVREIVNERPTTPSGSGTRSALVLRDEVNGTLTARVLIIWEEDEITRLYRDWYPEVSVVEIPQPINPAAVDGAADRANASDDTQISSPSPEVERPLSRLPELIIEPDDPMLALVRQLIDDGYGGILFRGPPGTSKTWYAHQIGISLAGSDPDRIRFVQFHPSYQYEDLMEGFIPTENGTFRRRRKHFLQLCRLAERNSDLLHIFVIDELSRTDPARVFGEALTYLEGTKRGIPFQLASGRNAVIPPNLIVIATMNVIDRGVDEVDAALERRFAMIEMQPDKLALAAILSENEVEDELSQRVVGFFEFLQRTQTTTNRIGQAYFRTVRDEPSLRRVWEHQLRIILEKAFVLHPEEFEKVERQWLRVLPAETTRAESPATEVSTENPSSTE
jgi:5-methylcytosine-specific restriction enzyme B